MTKEDYLEIEEKRDKLVSQAFEFVKSRMHPVNGLGMGECWIDESGVRIQVGYSVMGCADSESQLVTWGDLGL